MKTWYKGWTKKAGLSNLDEDVMACISNYHSCHDSLGSSTGLPSKGFMPTQDADDL